MVLRRDPGSRIRLWSSLLLAALILSACGGGSPVAMDPAAESDVVSLVAGGACAESTNSSGATSAITLNKSGVYRENFDGLGSGLPEGWSACQITAPVGPQANQGLLGDNIAFDPTLQNWAFGGGAATNRASIQGLVEGSSGSQQNASPNRALANRSGNLGQSFVFKLEETLGFQDFRLSVDAQTNAPRNRIVFWQVEYRVGDTGSFIDLGLYRAGDAFGSITLNSCNLAGFGSDVNNQPAPVFIRFRPVGGEGLSNQGASGFAIDNFQLTYRPIPAGRPLRPLRNLNCAVRPIRPTR
ncbi:MAG: hypothetical protein HC924_19150 [Synechococcaceae cyanobacterium SM2_3_2]|nr:hypothetical protein [Synechococcaceae cyanobacterium SM2_3_2]